MSPILLSGIVETVGKLADDLFTSDKERMDAQLELGKLALEERKLDVTVQMGQIAVNTEEAKSDSLFKSGWRPATGWACVGGLVYQLMFRPIFGWVAQNIGGWPLPPSLEMETLMTLLFGILGLGAYRTYEKKQGV
jgi:Holin of 3TMs, for gene-transfer release